MIGLVLAGIIAKGLGVIGAIFFSGVVLGVLLTVAVTTKLRHFGRR
jgi:cell division protein FtsX